MLDEYEKIQPITYKIIKNSIINNQISHAYLIETNGYNDSQKLITAIVKAFLCPYNYTNNKKCNNCNQCKAIEEGNFLEMEIIKPDGLWIKKEQLLKLQEEFSKTTIIGNRKIYIIQEANRLNKQAANSLLKFLEEPEIGITAILVAENIYNVIETIVSRCQLIRFQKKELIDTSKSTIEILKEKFYNESDKIDDEKIEKAINFVNYYEKNKLKTLLYTKKLWHDYIKNKEDYIKSFNIIIFYYKEILNKMTGRSSDIFKDYQKEIAEIQKNNSILSIAKKIEIFTKFQEKIQYNANSNLLIDKLIITLESSE